MTRDAEARHSDALAWRDVAETLRVATRGENLDQRSDSAVDRGRQRENVTGRNRDILGESPVGLATDETAS